MGILVDCSSDICVCVIDYDGASVEGRVSFALCCRVCVTDDTCREFRPGIVGV